jgi:hypothetical protein
MLTYSHYRSGKLAAQYPMLRPEQTAEQSGCKRRSTAECAICPIDGRDVYADKHLIRLGLGPGDFSYADDIGTSVLFVYSSFHDEQINTQQVTIDKND